MIPDPAINDRSGKRVSDMFAALCLIPHDHELAGLEHDLRKMQAEFDRAPREWMKPKPDLR